MKSSARTLDLHSAGLVSFEFEDASSRGSKGSREGSTNIDVHLNDVIANGHDLVFNEKNLKEGAWCARLISITKDPRGTYLAFLGGDGLVCVVEVGTES